MEWDGTGLGDRAIESLRRIHLLIFESIVYYSIGGDGGLKSGLDYVPAQAHRSRPCNEAHVTPPADP